MEESASAPVSAEDLAGKKAATGRAKRPKPKLRIPKPKIKQRAKKMFRRKAF